MHCAVVLQRVLFDQLIVGWFSWMSVWVPHGFSIITWLIDCVLGGAGLVLVWLNEWVWLWWVNECALHRFSCRLIDFVIRRVVGLLVACSIAWLLDCLVARLLDLLMELVVGVWGDCAFDCAEDRLFGRSIHRSIGRLITCSIDWFIDRFVDWLAARISNESCGYWIGNAWLHDGARAWQIGWLTDRSIDWLMDRSIGRLLDTLLAWSMNLRKCIRGALYWLVDQFVDRSINWTIACEVAWLIDCMIVWLLYCLISWLIDRIIVFTLRIVCFNDRSIDGVGSLIYAWDVFSAGCGSARADSTHMDPFYMCVGPRNVCKGLCHAGPHHAFAEWTMHAQGCIMSEAGCTSYWLIDW